MHSEGTREAEEGRKSRAQGQTRLYSKMAERGKEGRVKEGILNEYGYVSMRLFMDNEIWISYSSPLSFDSIPLLIFFQPPFLKCENNSQFIRHTEIGCGLHMACTGRDFATSGFNKCKHLVMRKTVPTRASEDNNLLRFHIFHLYFHVSILLDIFTC